MRVVTPLVKPVERRVLVRSPLQMDLLRVLWPEETEETEETAAEVHSQEIQVLPGRRPLNL